jgi:hypothetical protein
VDGGSLKRQCARALPAHAEDDPEKREGTEHEQHLRRRRALSQGARNEAPATRTGDCAEGGEGLC